MSGRTMTVFTQIGYRCDDLLCHSITLRVLHLPQDFSSVPHRMPTHSALCGRLGKRSTAKFRAIPRRSSENDVKSQNS
ncbi:hypothetical protein RRG08_022875 [Elysia crispata]|uniref:Uncharacterized protein n=1 Tax=Elysia crispata TaxID=231223 RepID=A0AAE0Z0K6_9GAST|nr:hypothetical protein RRG08_022875 [Elysia crispata]